MLLGGCPGPGAFVHSIVQPMLHKPKLDIHPAFLVNPEPDPPQKKLMTTHNGGPARAALSVLS